MISYKPLWRTLLDRDMTKTQLREKLGCSTSTLAKMSKNEFVALDLICKICYVLNCKIEEVVEIIQEKQS